MQFTLPKNLALFIASCASAFLLCCFEILISFDLLIAKQEVVFITTLFVFVFLYLIAHWSVHRFIYQKVKLIYKNIFKQKIKNSKALPSAPKLLEDVYIQVENWMKSNQAEMEKLQEQETYRREFLGNLAHELKTPVFSTQGFILTLIEGGLDDPKINHDFLNRAANGMERITNILQDLDIITRLESGSEEINYQVVNIIDLINEVLDSLEIKAQTKKITLSFRDKYEKPIKIICDRGKIDQVLVNLLVNSINYGKDNGRTEVRLYDMENKVMIEVSDNGLGIAQENISRVFERFYRVDKSRSRHSGGSGLGLAIVKHIIEAHGQSINVRSTVDVGTTFSFTLDKAN